MASYIVATSVTELNSPNDVGETTTLGPRCGLCGKLIELVQGEPDSIGYIALADFRYVHSDDFSDLCQTAGRGRPPTDIRRQYIHRNSVVYEHV